MLHLMKFESFHVLSFRHMDQAMPRHSGYVKILNPKINHGFGAVCIGTIWWRFLYRNDMLSVLFVPLIINPKPETLIVAQVSLF